MNILMNIIVLIFEVLYYSMFMKFAKNDGKFWKYLLLFSLITIFNIFIDSWSLYSHIILIILIALGIKYIVGIKIKLYDIFFIYIMFLYKIILELIFSYPLYFIFHNIYISSLIVCVIKTLPIIFKRKFLTKMYNKLNIIWNNNNFYIRYLFAIFNIVYIILSCVYIIIEFV